MHTSKCQFITRILNARGELETVEEHTYFLNEPEKGETLHRMHPKQKIEVRSNRANTFVEQKDERGLVRKRWAYNNVTQALQSTQKIEYDGTARTSHSRSVGDFWMEELAAVNTGIVNVTHSIKRYNDIWREDEYVVMIDDGLNCVVATYSYETGRLIDIIQIFPDEDFYSHIDFDEDGTIHEWCKQRMSE